MKIGKMEDKHIIALTVVGLAAVVYLFYTFVFMPQRTEIDQLSAQYQQEEQKVRQIEAFEADHPDMVGYLHELDSKKNVVDAMLPDDLDMQGFLIQGETAARQGHLPLMAVKYEKVSNQKGYREIPVGLNVQGDYFQTLSFIKNMEESPRFNSIKKVVMKMDKGSIKTEISSSIFVYGIPAGENKNDANGQQAKK